MNELPQGVKDIIREQIQLAINVKNMPTPSHITASVQRHLFDVLVSENQMIQRVVVGFIGEEGWKAHVEPFTDQVFKELTSDNDTATDSNPSREGEFASHGGSEDSGVEGGFVSFN